MTRVVAFGPLKIKYLDFANRIIFFFQILFYLYFCKYDLIYTRDFSFLVFLSWVPRFLRPKKKLIYEAHKIYYYTSDKVNDLRLEIECVKLPDKLIAISDGVRKELIQLGVEKDKIEVIPNGAKVDKFAIEFDVDGFRKANRISNKDVSITYTGSFELWKGVDVLIKAFARVLKKVENCKLILVGGCTESLIRTRELIKSLEIPAENMLLIGFVSQSEVAKYLKISDIGVIPTVGTSSGLRYTSPLKLFEYMAAGVPIVISDLPSAREILKEDEAVFFESENDNDLANKLVNLIYDKAKRQRLGFLMSQMVRDFTYEQRCQKLTKVIDSAMRIPA
jgi:glycosyltransferase involved in cell wall biosynthesis